LDDPLREPIHALLYRIDSLVKEFVQRNDVRVFDIPMHLLGLMHEVDTVGESRL
jgi:hypothetical protein